MIQIEEIHIVEFRGIRDLTLLLGSKSFVVWGPNGSGKSGVVDAIEFAFRGKISRLSGTGSGNVSVLQHGPHVHSRNDPKLAYVSLTVRDTVSGKTAVLTRRVASPATYTLKPDVKEVRAAVEKAKLHSEMALSRREIIRFVLAEPTKRSAEVQALLRLERLDKVRTLLRKLQGKADTDAERARSSLKEAEGNLKRHLDMDDLAHEAVLTVVNEHRGILGLGPIIELGAGTDFRRDHDSDESLSGINRASAVRDIAALVDALSRSRALSLTASALVRDLDALESDPVMLNALNQRDLVRVGIGLVADSDLAHCPLCDVEWSDVQALRAHLVGKLSKLDEVQRVDSRIKRAGREIAQALTSVRGLVETVRPLVVADSGPIGLQTRLTTWSEELVVFAARLGSIKDLTEERDRLAADPLAPPRGLLAELTKFLDDVKAKPDESATSRARNFVFIAQERWEQCVSRSTELMHATEVQTRARLMYDSYCEQTDGALSALYRSVESEFASYYSALNSDDESEFTARLEQSSGKLDLTVDFHGIGQFPPAAYHSEGHQDGMGVCLYLALVRQLLGEDFRLAVLDDVVMSVDSNHRKQFCQLLQQRFPDVQFVITTHDEVWARQMRASGLVTRPREARFHGWTVDSGPVYEELGDVWAKIQDDVAREDIPPAAGRLRRNLEATMADLAGRLKARVVYRADGNFELNELLSAVNERYGDLLKRAVKSATAWKNEDAKQRAEQAKAARDSANAALQAERWAVNPAVHYNAWANFTKEDFVPVVSACRQFLALFECENPDCGGTYVVGYPGSEEALRCKCGQFNLNLIVK